MKATLKFILYILLVWALTFVFACREGGNREVTSETLMGNDLDHKPKLNNNQELDLFLKRSWDNYLHQYPEFASIMGKPGYKNKLDNISTSFDDSMIVVFTQELDTLNSIDPKELDKEHALNHYLYRLNLESNLSLYPFRFHKYPATQFEGAHSDFPTFMINVHDIKDSTDASAYVERLRKSKIKMEQLGELFRIRAKKKMNTPDFVFKYVLEDCRNIIEEKGVKNLLYKDFKRKLDTTTIAENIKTNLLSQALVAIDEFMIPGYENFMDVIKEVTLTNEDMAGIWELPDGGAYYDSLLAYHTTSRKTADELHQIGIEEVKNTQAEMKIIQERVGFDGSLTDFFKFLREDSQFYYDETEEDKESMLSNYDEIIQEMQKSIPEFFIDSFNVPILIKGVEKFKEKTAPEAYYEEGSIDGSRTAVFRVNLYKMKNVPTYEMDAMAYHEAVPGHHLQSVYSMGIQDLPEFRLYADYSAYVEGWALYSENFPKEHGFYKDPYSDYGRLSMKLLRASRLVVDTGIHKMKWTREKAINYLMKNTSMSKESIVKEVDRYIVNPGQACAYMVGMLKIFELRDYAKTLLGDKFDLKQFHDILLKTGPVPLEVCDRSVKEWVESFDS